VADVRATAEYIDTYILVAEWARTGVSIIRRALESCPEIEGKLLGGIINKVDFKTLKYYDATSHSYSMRSEFARYFDRE
jgi:succinoglycan biosynthesis transport protein ExoP